MINLKWSFIILTYIELNKCINLLFSQKNKTDRAKKRNINKALEYLKLF